MPETLNIETLAFFLLFVVPGLIIVHVRSLFLTRTLPTLGEGLAGYIILSLIYHAAVFPFAIDIHTAPVIQNRVLWFTLIFVLPGIIGFLLGLSVQKEWLRKFFSFFKVNLVHPVKAAWDWKFNDCNSCYVQVVLKDGTRWAGYMGQNSFASSGSSDRDLYIEDVYIIGPDSIWTPNDSGVWLSHGEIQSIEVFNPVIGDKNVQTAT